MYTDQIYQRRNHTPWKKSWNWIKRQWFNAVLIYLAMHLLLNKQIDVQVGPETGVVTQTSMSVLPKIKVDHAAKEASSFPISNLTPILSPDYGERKGIPKSVIRAKVKVCKDYVRRYAPLAIQEMEQYRVPASITLAQGLLESNAGESRLALESANHFGIKCRAKCRGCTCRNYSDDDMYDMFRVFGTPEESFREHSLLLRNNQRYAGLFDLSPKDYSSWAHGLKSAGYATDKNYAYKLIKIIEALDLHKYDR